MGGDILYYAVNSMNLTPESNLNQAEAVQPPVAARVTYDADAQEALNRSFQPFTQHLYGNNEKTSNKRAIDDEAATHANKRFHEDGGGEFEVRAGDYVLT